MITKQEVVEMLSDSDKISDWVHMMHNPNWERNITNMFLIANNAVFAYERIIKTILSKLDEIDTPTETTNILF